MNLQQRSEWFTDIRIPGALINDENKFLEESIEAKLKEFTSFQLDIEENHDRIRMLEDHQKMIQDELEIIQRLLAACRTEETTERSHVDIDTAEMKRLERLILNFDIDLQRFTKRKDDFQGDIDQLNNQIAKISNVTLTEKEILEKLMNTMKKRDEEAFFLMKYTRQDDLRIRELTGELERYSEKSLLLKRATEDELIEYSGLQIELDKIADQFRRSHKQRQQLLTRWETILEQMQRKDADIDRLTMQLIQIKTTARTKEQQLYEQKLFSEQEQKNNIILDKLIDLTNQKIVRLRTQNEKQDYPETDILALKFALLNTQNQIQRERLFLNDIKSTIITKQQHLTKLRQRRERILDQKRLILSEKFSMEEKLSKYENLMENDQKYQNHLHIEHKKSTEKLFLLNNQLLSIRRHEKHHELANQSSRNQLLNLQNQLTKFDQQLLQQQELIYHQDFLKQSIDRRLNRIQGDKTINDKYSQSEEKFRQLQIDYHTKKSQYDQLQNQMKILHEEFRLNKHEYDQLIHEKNDLNNKFLQFDLYITLTDKMIRKFRIEKEDYLVEENFLKIELKRLKTILCNSNEMNSNFEQQQIEIQKAMKERRMEVQANCHLFRLRFHDERTKKITISTELALRITKIEKLKYRYETFAMGLNVEQSDKENALVQAQYVIKSALMKEDLLRQGDQLESLIMKAETELRALENTVEILKWNNIDVKKNFEKLNETSSEICEMKELEEHLRAMNEQVKIRRKLIKDFLRKTSMKELAKYEEEIEQTKQLIANKRRIQTKLEDEIEQYHIKIDRADQVIKRFQGNSEDIDVRLLIETTEKIEQQLISVYCDCTVLDTFQGVKLDRSPSLFSTKKKSEQSFTSLIPNIVHISIDHISSRTSTSESTRSKKSEII